jgi:hypothetical protein
MRVLRLERLPLLVHFAFAASFAVLLYFGIVGGSVYGPALLGVAGAWGAAVVTIEYSVVSKAYEQRVKRKAEREDGYYKLLTSADSYAAAWDSFLAVDATRVNAETDVTAAEKRLSKSYNHENKEAVDVAKERLLMTSQSSSAAQQAYKSRREEYERARDILNRTAPSGVRSALDHFDKCLTREASARDNARSRFVKAAQKDLRQRNWPEGHSLPVQPGASEPLQAGAVAVGQGEGAAVAGEHGHLLVGRRPGGAGHDAGRLAGQPRDAEVADGPGEALALRRGDVVEDRGMVDDHGRVGRRPGDDGGQVGEQVALDDGGR